MLKQHLLLGTAIAVSIYACIGVTAQSQPDSTTPVPVGFPLVPWPMNQFFQCWIVKNPNETNSTGWGPHPHHFHPHHHHHHHHHHPFFWRPFFLPRGDRNESAPTPWWWNRNGNNNTHKWHGWWNRDSNDTTQEGLGRPGWWNRDSNDTKNEGFRRPRCWNRDSDGFGKPGWWNRDSNDTTHEGFRGPRWWNRDSNYTSHEGFRRWNHRRFPNIVCHRISRNNTSSDNPVPAGISTPAS